MTTQTVQSASPVVMPRVNLMPPEIAEAQRLHFLQRLMGGAVLVSILLVGGLYWHAKQGMSSAEGDLSTAQGQNAALQAKYNQLDYVQQAYTQVQAKQQMLDLAMGQEIRWSFVLNGLTIRIPDNVWLTGLSATEASTPGSTTTPPIGADGSTTGVGIVSFTGTAFTHDQVANWLDAIAKERGFVDPSFANSTKIAIGERPAVSFTSQAILSDKAQSNRYTPKAGS